MSYPAADDDEAMRVACARAGLDPRGARLVGHGENAVYVLASPPVVARVGRSTERLAIARKEVAVARWLAAEGYPAARLADVAVEQPLVVGDSPVTLWRRLEIADEPPGPADLGRLMRELHGLAGGRPALPAFDPFAASDRRLATPPGWADPREVAFLRRWADEARARYADLSFVLPAGPVHGDPHPGNVVRVRGGRAVLIDFETFGHGQPEWDACLPAAYRHAFGWYSAAEYGEFTEAYGHDLARWPGFPTLRAIRELTMVTWLMSVVNGDPVRAAEYRRRVDDLRSGRLPRRWTRC